jgi:heptosyltransferase-3
LRNPVVLKHIDSVLGPVLLLLIGWLRRVFRGPATRPKLHATSRFGLLKIAAIGDTVLLSALVSDLRSAFPQSKITLFVGKSNFEFAKLLQGVDDVHLLDFAHPVALLRQVFQTRFDYFLDADSWPRVSALISALVRADFTIGFNCSGQHRHYAYDLSVTHSSSLHELENYRRLLRGLGVAATHPPQALRRWEPASEHGVLVFHLWPGGKKSHLKEWPIESWAQVAQDLLTHQSASILLTGSATDFVRNEALMHALPNRLLLRVKNVAGMSLSETIRFLQSAKLLVTVNTGIMHIGAAMGVPTLALHGPTSPLRWGPIGERTRSILSSDPDAGFLNLGFEYFDEKNRMLGILPGQVIQAAHEMLKLPTSAQPPTPPDLTQQRVHK